MSDNDNVVNEVSGADASAGVEETKVPPPAPEVRKETVFTQEQLDAIVQKRVAREKENVAEQVAAAIREEQARVAEQLNDASKRAVEAERAALEVGFASAVTVSAIGAGVSADQVEVFTRLVKLADAVDENGAVSQERVDEAVKGVLDKFPGLTNSGSNRVGGVPLSSSEKPALSLSEAVAKRLGS